MSKLHMALFAALLAAHPSGAAERRRPNIIFLLADDLGYGDVGFCPCPATNVLERMVASYLDLPFSAHSITFQGGEPLLAGIDFFRRAADAIRHHARRNAKIHLSIQTNAMLMTQ